MEGLVSINPGPLSVQGAASAASLVTFTNTAVTPGATPTLIIAAAVADRTLGIQVAGDGFVRLRVDSAGKIQWGSGNVTQDTNLYRQGVGTLRTDGAFSVGGTLLGASLGDPTAADIQPDGVQAAGAVGKLADSGHVHQEHAQASLYLAPTGALAETIPRQHVTINGSTFTSTGIYCRGIGFVQNQAMNVVNFFVGAAQASVGVTHGYYGIADVNRIVKAVTADQGSSTIWGTTSTLVSLALSPGFTAPSAGLYYLFASITATNATPGFAANTNNVSGLPALPPILYGQAGTSNTPPVVGSTLASFNVGNGVNMYGFIS